MPGTEDLRKDHYPCQLRSQCAFLTLPPGLLESLLEGMQGKVEATASQASTPLLILSLPGAARASYTESKDSPAGGPGHGSAYWLHTGLLDGAYERQCVGSFQLK